MERKQGGHAGQRLAYFAGTMKPGHDGVTRVLYRHIDAMHCRGAESLFFSPMIPPVHERPTEMVRVPSVGVPMYRAYRLAIPGRRDLLEHLLAFRPDLLHIHSPCSLGYSAVRVAQELGLPIAATYHTHFPSYAKYYRVQPLETLSWNYLRKLYNSCNRVYVPSIPILHELAGQGIHNLKYLPHGVDTTVFHPHYKSHEWKEAVGIKGKTALLFVGRLVWEKDLRTLAESYAILSNRRRDISFVLVGDGPIRQELQLLMPNALFLGQKSGAELSTAYASCDIFTFPSTTETFGNVTVEAMASGLVPVCARQGGSAGIVRPGVTGLLAEPRDAADFAKKVEYLLDQPGKRAEMADQGLMFARRQSWERVFDDLFTDYAELIEEHAYRHSHNMRKTA